VLVIIGDALSELSAFRSKDNFPDLSGDNLLGRLVGGLLKNSIKL